MRGRFQEQRGQRWSWSKQVTGWERHGRTRRALLGTVRGLAATDGGERRNGRRTTQAAVTKKTGAGKGEETAAGSR